MNAGAIAKLVSGTLIAKANVTEDTEFSRATSLEAADKGSVSFVSSRKYLPELEKTSAGLVFINKDLKAPDDISVIVVDNPYLAFLTYLDAISSKEPITEEELQSPVAESAKIASTTKIFSGAFIGSGSEIKDNGVIYPGVYIGKNVSIGENVVLHPNVVVYDNTVIGNNVRVHSGTVIGSDGFGYLEMPDGSRKKIPQIGNVIIEDDVEIGSNVSIDRAVFESTIIKKGVKIDNLVQIAHNVIIGEHSVLASQTGISGSSQIGKFVLLAGQVGVADHVKIPDRVIVTAKSGVPSSIKEPGAYSGIPVMPHNIWLRLQPLLRKLPEQLKKLKKQ
ncbi:MAG: UDP-3-O-(3-hydroxymyristoyl)glucosamine N-acyltransferase [Nitrospinae bacterium]|nr:UDP-3-O-(3-hydroxymyristoyl)glucosamine N-acyltransferase [Nitrospinota bacterium]